MDLLTDEVKERIGVLVTAVLVKKDYSAAARNIPTLLDELYANIPDDRRISYGRVHTVKVLSEYLVIGQL